MKIQLLKKLINNELLVKLSLVIVLFLGTFLIFKAFQKPIIYNATLKKVTYTYSRDEVLPNVVWKVDEPFYYMDAKNSVRWDGSIYDEIRKDYYNAGDHKYAFFPLFPLLWKVLHVNALFMGLLNYLLFGFSVILFSLFFFKNENTSTIERFCVFVVALTLPPIVVYYLPYADALFTFTFAIAMYGLIKNKYWLFFISIVLFSMTRPTFVIVGLSFVIIDFLYYLNHKNIRHFIKELSLKLTPLLLGTAIVFIMFYLNSGSFTKYFESVNTYWHTSFSIPTKISDWSTEGFGMNLFTIFIIIAASILFINHFIKHTLTDKSSALPSIFNGNASFISEYFFRSSIFYFLGVFTFIIFFQAGSLNGLSRYIIGSPFFFMFFFYMVDDLKKLTFKRLIILLIPLSMLSLMLFMSTVTDPKMNFNDSGYFIFLLALLYLFFLKSMNNLLKIVALGLLVLYSIVWIAYLYNVYLCNGWIFT